MFTLKHLTIGKPFFAALGIIIVVCLLARFALATEPTNQQKAAAELPKVQSVIDDTQEAADRNATAKNRKAQLLTCIMSNDCDFMNGKQQAD